MKFEIKNRWTGKVQFTAEIEADADTLRSVKIGLAVKWGYKAGANLSDADLRSANLSGADLSDAVLCGANLSDAVLCGADLSGANLRSADLRSADLRSADLSDADLCGANLSDAVLCGADLCGANLRSADLRSANLRSADLSDADLCGANLSDAVLCDADLSGANLRSADLCGANLRDAPVIENIHQKIYQAASQPGALNMGDWHTCDTTHCRAGWAVTLAGDEGKALETTLGSTAAAATLIYIASDKTLDRVPDFYCSNETALADMKRLADIEAARVAA